MWAGRLKKRMERGKKTALIAAQGLLNFLDKFYFGRI